MKKFSELNVGDEFFSEGKISLQELENYLSFSGIKNVLYKNSEDQKIVSGRAILGRMEGEFTKLKEMYGNLLIFYGMDGDPSWKGRHARFLKPFYTDELLKMKFKIAEKTDLNENYGLLSIDFEGFKENGDLVVVARHNLYQIKKDPPTNQ
jgi:hypothetical protein